MTITGDEIMTRLQMAKSLGMRAIARYFAYMGGRECRLATMRKGTGNLILPVSFEKTARRRAWNQ